MRLLLIDNFDSFTYNVQQMLRMQGAQVEVARNDATDIAKILKFAPNAIVLSPGPGGPNQSGICIQVVEELGQQIPILGICLGLQIISQVHGAVIKRAPIPMHGKISKIQHKDTGIFKKIPQDFQAMRYHSLCVEADTLPQELNITARSEDSVIMGVMHSTRPLHAVQFHPESFMTQYGDQITKNFLDFAAAWNV